MLDLAGCNLPVCVIGEFVRDACARLLLHVGEAEAGRLVRELLQRWGQSRIDPASGLPRDDEIQEASRAALRAAVQVLLMEVASRLEPAKPWVPRLIDHVRAGMLFKVPLIEAGRDPRREWVDTVRAAVAGGDFGRLHDGLRLRLNDVGPGPTGEDAAVGGHLADALLGWARREADERHEPPEFEQLLREGWIPAGVRRGAVTVSHAYRLFFRELLRRNAVLFRTVLAETVDELSSLVAAGTPVPELDLEAFERWLQPRLGGLAELLGAVSADLAAVAQGQHELAARHGEILVALTALCTEIARGNVAAQAPLGDLRAFIRRLDDAFREMREDVSGLRLIRPGVPPRPDRTGGDLWMVQAKHRALALVGRASELEALRAWLDGPAPISIRLLVGPAGAGKTRLSFELVWQLTVETGTTWHAGRLSAIDLRAFDERRSWSSWRWTGPTLIVIDYARSVHHPLSRMLEELCLRDEKALPPLRVLLLERSQGATREWVDELLSIESSDRGRPVRVLFDPPEAVPLAALEDTALRRLLLGRTLTLAAEFRGERALELPAVGQQPELDRQLAESRWSDPLHLCLAAVVAHDAGSLLAGLRCTHPDLAFAMARRELKRIERFTRDRREGHVLRHLAGCMALEGGLTTSGVLRTVSQELAALERTWPGGAGDLAGQLGTALPDGAGGVQDIEPDFIREAVILEALGARLPSDTRADRVSARLLPWLDAVARCAARRPFTVTATLVHAFQNFGHLPEYKPALLAAIDHLGEIGRRDETSPLLSALEDAMPSWTVGLRLAAAEVSRALYLRTKALQSGRDDVGPELARLAANLGLRLGDIGQREEALAAAREAVAISRSLVQQDPGAFQADLAAALTGLMARLVELGHRDEALVAAREAVDVYRLLAAQNADLVPDLAMALSNVGYLLREAGRHAEALIPAQEAVDVHRAAADAHAARPELAISLTNLGALLGDLEKPAEALAVTTEAATVYRVLARQNPDAFRPALAMSLSNLGAHLGAMGRQAESLAVAQEAVEVCRSLVLEYPDAFRPILGTTLINLAGRLNDQGHQAEALVVGREAVDIHRRLAALQPDVSAPKLAVALGTLGSVLRNLGQREEALACGREAMEICRQLDRANPEAFRPALAASLVNLGLFLGDVGQLGAALAVAREAADLYRILAARNPTAFRATLATALSNLGLRLDNCGRTAEAVAVTHESVSLARALVGEHPDAYRPTLAMVLNNLAGYVSDADAALVLAEEAVALFRTLAGQRPDAFESTLALSLTNQANQLLKLARSDEALTAARESVAVHRRLVARMPDAARPNLAMALNNLGDCLAALGHFPEAHAVVDEAVVVYRELVSEHAERFEADLAMSLVNLAKHVDEQGHDADALEPVREAVALYRAVASRDPDAARAYLANTLRNQGVRFAELEQWPDAVAHAAEAVALYRVLASDSPEPFQPELAKTLGGLGAILLKADRCAEAIPVLAEAIAGLLPSFTERPHAIEDAIILFVQAYLEASQRLGTEPDAALLAPIFDVLDIGDGETPGST